MMDEQKLNNLLQILAKLKMSAFKAGTICNSFKDFNNWWSKHWKERADFELGQQAEIVYMFLLGLLWKEVKNFEVATYWVHDKGGIDFKINNYPVQLKTGVMSPKKLAVEQAKAAANNVRFENILIKKEGEYTDEFYVLEKLCVPDLFEDIWEVPLGNYPEIGSQIWLKFCQIWEKEKDPERKKKNL